MNRKRTIPWMLLCMCLLGGCQKTPDQQIVREKGKDSIAQYEQETQAQAQEGSRTGGETAQTLAEKLEAPSWYEDSFSSDDGSLKVICSARVEIPDVTQVSVYEVSQKPFDQNLAVKFAAAFAKTQEIYDPEAYFSSGEKIEIPIQVPTEEMQNRFAGIFEKDGGTYLLFFKTESATPMTMEVQKQDKFIEANGFYTRDMYEWNSAEAMSQTLKETNISLETLEQKAGITAEEAVAAADEKVAEFGMTDMKAREQILSVDRTSVENESGSMDASKWDTAWMIGYTREIDGFPVTYDEAFGVSTANMDDVTVPWGYERLTLVVNQEGIQQVMCYDLYDIGEKTADNVKLKPFSEIMDIFKEMIQIQNASMEEFGIASKQIRIERITLGYCRIYDPSSAQQTGLLVPVWDFYGPETIQSTYGGENMEYEDRTLYTSRLTINALDGTIIDRELGY